MSGSEIKPLLETPMSLGECPLWHPNEEVLYWIDIGAKSVHCFDPSSGNHRHWPLPYEPGCIAYTKSDGLIVAMRDQVALLDTASGRLTRLLDAPYNPAFGRFNDGRCDARGRFWLGTLYDSRDRPGGSLYCIERGTIRDLAKPVTVSNGIAFNRDASVLYHADTSAHRIVAYDFDLVNGALSGARLFHQFPSEKTRAYGGRPDGAAVDSEDAYWCAMYEGSRIVRLAPSGEMLQEIPLPVRCPTMVAFGGQDLRTLFISTARHNRPADELNSLPLSGFMLTLRVDVPGRRESPYEI